MHTALEVKEGCMTRTREAAVQVVGKVSILAWIATLVP
jgi:hypothetical protein